MRRALSVAWTVCCFLAGAALVLWWDVENWSMVALSLACTVLVAILAALLGIAATVAGVRADLATEGRHRQR